jgi:YD repeat-containing protein
MASMREVTWWNRTVEPIKREALRCAPEPLGEDAPETEGCPKPSYSRYALCSLHNNGRVTQTVDGSEIVNYTYDHLNRLISAVATNNAWGENYTYDGFGNLTGKTPTVGSAPAFSGGAGSNNQQGQLAPNFDIEQRMTTSGGTSYVYDTWGRRIWRQW